MSKANKIRGLLTSSNKNQIGLAEYMGISSQAIRNKFSRDSFSADDLIKISEYIGGKLTIVADDLSIVFNGDDINLIKDESSTTKPKRKSK